MNKIYLTCCFGLDFDLPLLKHFIKHYTDLGIKPENFLLVLNVFKDITKLREGIKILKDFKITPKDVWNGEYESREKWARVDAVLSEHVKPDDWVVHPDSDEFISFPAKLDYLVKRMREQKLNAAQGFLIDRLAADGKIKDVVDDEPLDIQFPVKANLSNLIGIAGIKLVLYRGNLRANNGSGQIHENYRNVVRYTHGSKLSLHTTEISKKYLGDYEVQSSGEFYAPGKFDEEAYKTWKEKHGFLIHHYKWHGTVIEKLRQRVLTYTRLKRAQVTQSRRLLDHYEKNERFVF